MVLAYPCNSHTVIIRAKVFHRYSNTKTCGDQQTLWSAWGPRNSVAVLTPCLYRPQAEAEKQPSAPNVLRVHEKDRGNIQRRTKCNISSTRCFQARLNLQKVHQDVNRVGTEISGQVVGKQVKSTIPGESIAHERRFLFFSSVHVGFYIL